MTLETGLYAFAEQSLDMFDRAEQILLELEQTPENYTTVDELYRIIHTIKGDAGVFGFEGVVGFCHVVETALNVIRDDYQKLDKDLITLLLICCDNIMQLIDRALYGNDPLGMETRASSDHLAGQLFSWMGVEMPSIMDKEYQRILSLKKKDQQHSEYRELLNDNKISDERNSNKKFDKISSAVASRDKTVYKVSNKNWHISLRFNKNVFSNGMDPVSFFEYLNSFGCIINMTTLVDGIPGEEQFSAEKCYLGFELDYNTNVNSKKIYEAFDFVIEDSVIYILPPKCDIRSYAKVIERLSKETSNICEILLAVETINASEYQIITSLLGEKNLSKYESEKYPEDILIGSELQANSGNEFISNQAAISNRYELPSATMRETIRVDVAKLDHLINMLNELQVSVADTEATVNADKNSLLESAVEKLSDLAGQIHKLSLNLRMLPISEIFNRYRRVVRDLSNDLNKNIELKITGGDIEIDKFIAEKITAPLLHLVRNAVDHGIEPSQLRSTKDKPLTGIIKLHAYYDTSHLVIEISDDGKGLSRDQILAKALQRDFIKANQILTDYDVFQLIFEPGFSTRTEADAVSGRGFGMDIVRENIFQLGGNVAIKSQQEEGTTFIIQLPLRSRVVEGLHVKIADRHCVIPQEYIVDCVEFDKYTQGISMMPKDHRCQNEHSSENDEFEQTPCICLAGLFDDVQNMTSMLKTYVVVVSYNQQHLGLIVDQIVKQCTCTAIPIEKNEHDSRLFPAMSRFDDGQEATILSIKALYHMMFVAKSDMGSYKVEHYDFKTINDMHSL